MWPEPITQPTLDQFLHEINYFGEPKKFVNIGVPIDKSGIAQHQQDEDEPWIQADTKLTKELSESEIEELLKLLGDEPDLPHLDLEDANVNSEQLTNLALTHGIYRDLFDPHIPKSGYIDFTTEQAQRLDRMIPDYWITDLPYSRVKRIREEPRTLYYFEPIVSINAKFVQTAAENSSDGAQYAHEVYHGNIIPASEALVKPSITLSGSWCPIKSQSSSLVKSSRYDNWNPGNVTASNFDKSSNESYYSVLMLNLDSLHQHLANLHWFVANISVPDSSGGALKYEEVCDYLPVHGIKGFGHSRYVFLALQHSSKLDVSHMRIDDFSLESRKFDTKSFIDKHCDKNLIPVGVSWFQTTWDASSNAIFHDYMRIKSPVYETILPKYEPSPVGEKAYPGKVPFNIFLDHCRSTKDINKQVLLERLRNVDPFDYRDQYLPPKVPPTIFQNEEAPSWMTNVMLKKASKVGYWRGLRPPSATIPLNNNADLDHPMRPFAPSKTHPPGHPNMYEGKPLIKKLKDMPVYSKPVNEHQSVYIQEDHEIHVEAARKMMEASKADDKREKAEK